MKTYYYLILVCLSANFCLAQKPLEPETEKANKIFFAEMLLGLSGGSAGGFGIGVELNYQRKSNLFSARYINQTAIKTQAAVVGFTAFPIFTSDLKIDEVSVLYGKRYINANKSFSFSGGLSINNSRYIGNSNQDNSQFFIGFPLEFNIKWFKANKKRFRAYYGIIPIGKPTSFGRSLGFKLYGNIGKLSYLGIGLNYGFGWHKKY